MLQFKCKACGKFFKVDQDVLIFFADEMPPEYCSHKCANIDKTRRILKGYSGRSKK